jgi:hypothetical protein
MEEILLSLTQLALSVIVIIFLWLMPPLLTYYFTRDWTVAGHIGEAFGGASSLFSGITLIGILYTIWSERKDAQQHDAQISIEQKVAVDQIIQLSLATQLQSCRAMLGEHRRSIRDLNPSIDEVPVAPTLLRELQEKIRNERPSAALHKRRNEEIIHLIDELLVLQESVSSIHDKMAVMSIVQSGQ